MKAPIWLWRGTGVLALLLILAAGAYLRREPGKTVPTLPVPPAADGGEVVPQVSSSAPGNPVILRGAERAPLLNLPEVVARLKQETSVQAPTLTPAVAALLSDRGEERAEAVETLGFSEDPRFIAPLVHLLQNDPETAVRAASASALELYHGADIAAALGQALTDPSEDVRAQALLSLQVQRDSHVERELQKQLKNGGLDEQTALEVRLFLDRHYVRKDPFKDPLEP